MTNVSVFPTPLPERDRPADGSASHLIAPHGGELVDLMADAERAAELKAASRDWPSWDLTPRQFCDLELLLNGGFSPLTGFMSKADHDSVCERMRLADGTLWPIPILLDVTAEMAEKLRVGGMLALRDPEGVMLAALHVEEIWEPDREASAQATFGTTNPEHPGRGPPAPARRNRVAVGGRLEGMQLPIHYDFRALRQTPAELRAEFAREGWRRVVAFQTRNPMHRAHCELTLRAAKEVAGQPADPPHGRHDQAGRHRPLHPRALLPGGDAAAAAAHRQALAAAARHAHGRPARGGAPRA